MTLTAPAISSSIHLTAGPVSPGVAIDRPARLDHLDGIRGLTALYVVVSHISLDIAWGRLPHPIGFLQSFFGHGLAAVAIFIVLSGFCLMRPLTLTGTLTLPRGFRSYISRRAWRILPPYYAALALSWLLMILTPGSWVRGDRWWSSMWPITDAYSLLAHLLQLHNLFPAYIGKINSPMWSVATEWQIYFVFPLLLLPVLRRTNLLILLVAAFATGIVPAILFPQLQEACPWFVGLFALGMMASALCKGVERSPASAKYWLVAILPVLSTLIACKKLTHNPSSWTEHLATHSSVGGAAACMLIACMSPGSRIAALLRWRPLVLLGAFSYSLYLLHAPVIGLIRSLLDHAPLTPIIDAVAYALIALPASLLSAYLFYLLAERPFLSLRSRSWTPSALSFHSSPAATCHVDVAAPVNTSPGVQLDPS